MFECEEKLCPSLFVIFGATGDLTHRKLLPALYNLHVKKNLPKDFAIVAVARRDKTHEDFRKDAEQSVKKTIKTVNSKLWNGLSKKIYYYKKDFDDKESYSGLKKFLIELDKKHRTKGNRTFYLSTMPRHFTHIISNLKKHKFISRTTKNLYKIVIEKPFGFDLDTAKELNNTLTFLFKEEEIYRIDHYLGKETVQNLFALRFANRVYEAVWNADHIENVQITAAESLGVETRGNFYDNSGAVRDMVQNHLLQLLALVAMEPPKKFTSEEIKDEKVKVLKSVHPIKKQNVIFGQYDGYRNEKGVNEKSRTETFSALKVFVDNARWKNTPFYLRTGKGLKRKATELVVYFKEPKMAVFSEKIKKNVLVIRLQPDEEIMMRFNIKKPGNMFDIERVSMDFCHQCLFGYNTPEAYEKLIYDILIKDKTLFTRWDEVQQAWKIVDPIIGYWNSSKNQPITYRKGSWGPEESNDLLEKQGHHWRLRKEK